MTGQTRPNSTAIIGVGSTPMVRHSEESFGKIALLAALAAIEDAGLRREDIDGYISSSSAMNPGALHADGLDEVSSGLMASMIGLREPRWILDVRIGPLDALVAAVLALNAGACDHVLIVRALRNLPGRSAGERGGRIAGREQFTVPYGAAGVSPTAQWYQRYMHEFGATREELYTLVGAQRRYANENPVAYWKGKDLSREEYLAARWVYEPLSLFDCDLPVTGAGAVIVTSADRGRDLPQRPAYVSGFASNRLGAARVFEAAEVPREAVQVAQLYDGYSPLVYHWLEELGFCGRGEAHAFIQDGRIEPGGALPLNTFGGALSEGRLQGMGHLREAALQVMHRAGPRQVPGADHAIVTVGGPNLFSWAVILSGG